MGRKRGKGLAVAVQKRRPNQRARDVRSRQAKREAFLEQLRDGWSIAAGCRAAEVDRTTVYGWRDRDPDFAAQWEAAVEAGTDALRDVAVARGREKSDLLLMFTLKQRDPSYRDNVRLELTGRHGGPVQTELVGAPASLVEVMRALRQAGAVEGDALEGEATELPALEAGPDS